jgi:lipopolysaccharide export LptBFGC system permease protein LptF
MPVILASLVFAITLSLLPYTEHDAEKAEMARLRQDWLKGRDRKRTKSGKDEEQGNAKIRDKRSKNGKYRIFMDTKSDAEYQGAISRQLIR